MIEEPPDRLTNRPSALPTVPEDDDGGAPWKIRFRWSTGEATRPHRRLAHSSRAVACALAAGIVRAVSDCTGAWALKWVPALVMGKTGSAAWLAAQIVAIAQLDPTTQGCRVTLKRLLLRFSVSE